MKQSTQAEWIRLKARRGKAAESPQQDLGIASPLPEDLFLSDTAYVEQVFTPAEPERSRKRRQFRRLDEAWAEKLLADPRVPPMVRLVIVLLAEADFHRHIKITTTLAKEAGLTRHQKRAALKYLERQGYIAVAWRGSGRAPIATPLHLGGRPNRR
jgi:hypothetical protein